MSKRAGDYHHENGREKRRERDERSDADVVFRILCPQARIGSLLGKHGVIIQSIRESTGARLKLADPIPGTDERVIIISARSDKHFRSGDPATDGDAAVDRPDDWSVAQEALIRVHARIADADGDNREFRDKDGAEGGASNGAANSGGTPARLLVPSSQIGCLLGKGGSIIAGMRQDSGAHIRIFNKDKLPPCALPTDELVQVTGEYPVVQKALELISIRLRRSPPRDPPNFLAMHPTSGHHQPAGYQPAPGYQASGYHRGADSYPPRSAPAAAFPPQGYSPYALPQSYAAAPSLFGGAWGAGASAGGAHCYGGMGGGGRGGGGAEGAAVEMELRVLCPADKVGIVIGKGGSRIKQIKEETGARVKVTEAVADCDERIVIIDAMEAPFSGHSPTEVALFRVHAAISRSPPLQSSPLPPSPPLLPPQAPFSGHSPTEEALFRVHAAISQHHAGDRAAGAAEEGGRDTHGVTARLLVRKGQVGCVMGKGGSIISELRSTSRARINIPPRDQLPKCADESDEVLVVSGASSGVTRPTVCFHVFFSLPPPVFFSLPPPVFFSLPPPVFFSLPPPPVFFSLPPPVFFSLPPPRLLLPPPPGLLLPPPPRLLLPLPPPSSSTRYQASPTVSDEPHCVSHALRLICARIRGRETVSGEPHCVSHALRLICARIRGRETAVASKGAAAGDARAAAGGARAGAGGGGGYAETGRGGGGGGGYGYPGSSSRGDGAYGYSTQPAAAAAPAVVATLSAAGPDGTVGWSYEPKVEPSYHGSGISSFRVDSESTSLSHPPLLSSAHPSFLSSQRGSGWDVAPAAAQEYGSYSHASAPASAHFSSPPPTHTAAAASAGGTTGGGSASAGAAGGSGGAAGGGVMTALVTVPAVAAGAVIGKGGANIQQIKSISGARVRMYEGREGESERVVEVVGSADQVQAAQAIIHAFVIKGTAAAERHAERRDAY
ncbi:unnamed protein product [Closterium sp. NIES-65]|nr:unnamed protein product [Closterium sp. NIES-65]